MRCPAFLNVVAANKGVPKDDQGAYQRSTGTRIHSIIDAGAKEAGQARRRLVGADGAGGAGGTDDALVER